MFKRNDKQKKNRPAQSLSQYGLFDIPSDFNTEPEDDDEGDSDLEAELAALSGGPSPPHKKITKKALPDKELQAMVANSIKDVEEDDDESVDENDPDLLSELNELTGDAAEAEDSPSESESVPTATANAVTILSNRIQNYEAAEKIAKECGETSKARRYGRAIKTLKDLHKQAQSGKPVNLSDENVPPEIDPNKVKPTPHPTEIPSDVPLVPSRTAPTIPETASEESAMPKDPFNLPTDVQEKVEQEKANIDEELLGMLSNRQKEYKVAALKAKKSGDSETAIKFVRIAKQFDLVMEAVQNGQPVDLSKMPGPPGEPPKTEPQIEENEKQQNTIPEIAVPEAADSLPEPILKTATTVLEALEQRLAVYKEHEAKAKEEGNSSKARRHGRIIKQFEQAIKAHKAGKPVAFDELPTPPGYGPIPGQVPSPSATQEKPETSPRPAVAAPIAPLRKKVDGDDESVGTATNIPGGSTSTLTTHAQKQVLILMAKQKQFKEAALKAKKQGDLVQAKEFLRQAKGFEKLLEAAQAGLPIDWSSIPVSPDAKSQLDNEYHIAMAEDVTGDPTVDLDILSRLENQLQKQLKMCLTTRDHNKAIGDVAGTNKFERLALNVTKDLDIIRVAKRTSRGAPNFHYEMKSFAIVKSFPEIMDNHMEVTIHRGINYQSDNPKDIDTYVKLDFPFPQDAPFSDRTSTIRNTNNPEYQKTFVIPIQRNSRQCQRTFKRHGVKFEIFSKGGLFRSDSLIGTVNVKLQPLETQCEIHDSFDLLDGRKKVGGKLEIQMKLRSPIVTQQVENIQEKWLVIDH